MALKSQNPKVRDDDARGTPAGAGQIVPAHGGRIGNPPYEASERDRIQVEAWCKVGTTQADMAMLLEISDSTLRRHYRRELDVGALRVEHAIAASLTQKALAGNLQAQMFWLRYRGKAGWGGDEQAAPARQPVREIDLTAFDRDARALLKAALLQLKGNRDDGSDLVNVTPNQ